MLIVTTENIPGRRYEVLGVVKGNVVQSKNFGKDFMSAMKTLVGGEITAYTEMLGEARQIASAAWRRRPRPWGRTPWWPCATLLPA